MNTRGRVLRALGKVHDPELDEPITTLGFVSACEVSPHGDVRIHLRLPTPQCAPNFAFLMAADARDSVRRLPGVRVVEVELEDHYTGDEINAAVRADGGFASAFPGESERDDLDALRSMFERKALVARQGRVCEELIASGLGTASVCELRVSDLPDGPDVRRCLELRAHLGIDAGQDAPAFVLANGSPVVANELDRWLRMARLVRTSLDVNGGICRSLLNIRNGAAVDDQPEVLR
jgi:metal-sulfur cluster biosynthetic enzyme